MAESKACEAPVASGPRRGLPATGTKAGYERHRKINETPCAECAAWHSEWFREYRKRPGVRERSLVNNRRYYAKNAEWLRAYAREYGQQHRDQSTHRAKKWRVDNADRHRQSGRERQRRRRAQLSAALVIPYTADQLAARLSMYVSCWICGGDADTIDHVKPISKGGAHILANIRPACQPCNTRKKDHWPFEAATKGVPNWGTSLINLA